MTVRYPAGALTNGADGTVALVTVRPGGASALLATSVLLYAALPSPWRALALPIFATGAYLSPRHALLLALVVLPAYFNPPAVFGYRFAPHTLATGLTALAIAVRWITLRSPAPLFRGWKAPLALATVAFLVSGVLSLTVTIAPAESLRALREVIFIPVLFFVLAHLAFADDRFDGRPGGDFPRDRLAGATAIAVALVVAAVVAALIGLVQYALRANLIEAEGAFRIRALYGSPNNLGMLLGRAIPLAAALALAGHRLRWLYLAALAPLLLALGLTFSVGAWLGTAAGLLVVALTACRRGPWLLLGALGVVALAALPILRVERVISHLDLADSTTFFRLKIWESGLAMLRDHPALGIGLDAFLAHYDPARGGRYMRPEAWQESTISHPHNLVLDAWLSLGLLGLAATLALLYMLARDLGRALRSSSPEVRALAAGAAGLTADFLVHGSIDNSYFLPDLAVIFWALCAMVRLLIDTSGQEAPGPNPVDPGRIQRGIAQEVR